VHMARMLPAWIIEDQNLRRRVIDKVCESSPFPEGSMTVSQQDPCTEFNVCLVHGWVEVSSQPTVEQ